VDVLHRCEGAMVSREKILALAKGFRGRAKNCMRIARQRVEKGLQYAYRDRKQKKRDMRSLWIQRINAGARLHGLKYGQLMHGLKQDNVEVNRMMLSELAMNEPKSFQALVDRVKHMRGVEAPQTTTQGDVQGQA